VDGEGGFADAAFLVLDGDDHGGMGGRKVWFRISRFVIFYDKPDLRVSGFQVLQKYGWRLKPRLHERNPPSRVRSFFGLESAMADFVCLDAVSTARSSVGLIMLIKVRTIRGVRLVDLFERDFSDGFFCDDGCV
jgi:hypothetical protein